MIWILALHIAALLCWCASLLYLLSLMASACPSRAGQAADKGLADLPLNYRHHDSLARFIFTAISTPVALLAIASGTAVFLLNQTTDSWLIVKMTIVTGLVAGHATAGGLVLKLEAGDSVRTRALVMTAGLSVLMLLIAWIVLAKPESGADLWGS